MDTIWPQLPFQNRLPIGSSQTHSPEPDYCPLFSGVPTYQGRLVICPLSLEYPLLLTESHFPFQGSWKAPSLVKPSWIFQLKLVCSSLYTPMAQGKQVYSAFFLLYTTVNTQICCLGYRISPSETQDICPHIFLLWAVPHGGSLYTVCMQYCLLGRMGSGWKQVCFWEATGREEMKLQKLKLSFSLNSMLFEFLLWYNVTQNWPS